MRPNWVYAIIDHVFIFSYTDMRRDVQDIFRMTPHEKQVMMFSATLSKEIRPVCKKFMQDVSYRHQPKLRSSVIPGFCLVNGWNVNERSWLERKIHVLSWYGSTPAKCSPLGFGYRNYYVLLVMVILKGSHQCSVQLWVRIIC